MAGQGLGTSSHTPYHALDQFGRQTAYGADLLVSTQTINSSAAIPSSTYQSTRPICTINQRVYIAELGPERRRKPSSPVAGSYRREAFVRTRTPASFPHAY